jgi:Ca2+-binding RTX toxin-like protein
MKRHAAGVGALPLGCLVPRRRQPDDQAMNAKCPVLVLLVAAVLAIGASDASGGEARLCDGQPATIVGTPRHNILYGTDQRDVISALAGADLVTGLDSRDRLCGGPGADIVVGNFGEDRLYGGPGRDIVRGLRGFDHLFGGSGADKVVGATGFDTIDGGADDDKLFGHGGSDHLFGSHGDDRLIGGRWNDHLFGEQGRDYLEGDDHFDICAGGGDVDTEGPGCDTVRGIP